MVLHEVGGLGGFHYVTTHQGDVKGVAFYETWIDVCPDHLEATPANPTGVCRKDTLAPFALFPFWETLIYPSEQTACAWALPIFSSGTVQVATERTLSQDLIDEYFAPYHFAPDCSGLGGLLNFPRSVPVPVPGEPAIARQLYDDYIAELKSWTVPKLQLVGDPGGFGFVHPDQVPYAISQYPNLDARCIGRANHFGPEDVPFNLVDVLLDWASDEGLLSP